MPDKVLAFYIRLSSEDRDLKTNVLKNESNSVFNQRRLLQDYYDTHESLHGYKVIVFCDDGVTGTHFDRPKFDELIAVSYTHLDVYKRQILLISFEKFSLNIQLRNLGRQ